MSGFVKAQDAVTEEDFSITIEAVRHFIEHDANWTAQSMLRVAAFLHVALLESAQKYDPNVSGRLYALNEIKIGQKSFREIAEVWPPNLRRYFR